MCVQWQTRNLWNNCGCPPLQTRKLCKNGLRTAKTTFSVIVVADQGRVDSEARFAIFLARILWKMRLASRENISASLARREKCDILWSLRVLSFNLRDSQTSKIIIHCEKLVLDKKLSQDSRVKISNDSRESPYEISACKTRESRYKTCLRDSRVASLAMKFLSVRLVRSESHYKI
jgi:hypothetical protein